MHSKQPAAPPDTHLSEHTGLRSAHALSDILSVPVDRICLWVSHGLIDAVKGEGDELYFDFRAMAEAQTLRDLSSAGVSLKKLRRRVQQLRELKAASGTIVMDEQVYARLAEGELVESDGQLCLEFARDNGSGSDALSVGPTTASQWYAAGVEREADGDLNAATDAYRRSLMIGGPNATTCFALAHALAESGEHAQAAERYRQVIELEPHNADAWNNLGIVLSTLEQYDAACEAFRKAIVINPADARAQYNLADTLDELGRSSDAAPHWRDYLRHDGTSAWAAHARRRLASV